MLGMVNIVPLVAARMTAMVISFVRCFLVTSIMLVTFLPRSIAVGARSVEAGEPLELLATMSCPDMFAVVTTWVPFPTALF